MSIEINVRESAMGMDKIVNIARTVLERANCIDQRIYLRDCMTIDGNKICYAREFDVIIPDDHNDKVSALETIVNYLDKIYMKLVELEDD